MRPFSPFLMLLITLSSKAQKFSLNELIELRVQKPKAVAAKLRAKKYEFDKISTPFYLYAAMKWHSTNQEDAINGLKTFWYAIEKDGKQHVEYSFILEEELKKFQMELKNNGFRVYISPNEMPKSVIMEFRKGKLTALLSTDDTSYSIKLYED